MVYLPEQCLNAEFKGSCEPLSQTICDDKNHTYDCCGRLFSEYREGDVKFRYCLSTPIGEGENTSVLDCSERDIIGTIKLLSEALYVIANQRNNTEVMPFQPLKKIK